MTNDARMVASLTGGRGLAFVGSTVAALVRATPDEPVAKVLGTVVPGGLGAEDAIDALLRDGISELPALALAWIEDDALRLVLRGSATATLDGEDMDAGERLSWREEVLPLAAASTVELRLPPHPDDPVDASVVPLVAGIAPARSLLLRIERVGPMVPLAPPEGSPDDRLVPAVTADFGHLLGQAPPPSAPATVAATPTSDPGPHESPPESPGEAGDGDQTLSFDTSAAGAVPRAVAVPDPPAPATPPAPASSGRSGFIESMPGLPLPGSAVSPTPPAPPPTSPPASPPPPSAPPPPAPLDAAADDGSDEGDEEGKTVSLAALRAQAAGPSATPARTVQAVHCPVQHPNPTHATHCRRCGASISNRTISVIPSPVLGVLVFADGTRVELDRPLLIGRKPATGTLIGGEEARAIRRPNPDNVLSRTHLEVRLDGWEVAVLDRDSRNLTFVELPGQDPFQLDPSLGPVTIPPGTVVRLGEREELRLLVQ